MKKLILTLILVSFYFSPNIPSLYTDTLSPTSILEKQTAALKKELNQKQQDFLKNLKPKLIDSIYNNLAITLLDDPSKTYKNITNLINKLNENTSFPIEESIDVGQRFPETYTVRNLYITNDSALIEGSVSARQFVHPFKLTIPLDKLKKLEIENLKYLIALQEKNQTALDMKKSSPSLKKEIQQKANQFEKDLKNKIATAIHSDLPSVHLINPQRTAKRIKDLVEQLNIYDAQPIESKYKAEKNSTESYAIKHLYLYDDHALVEGTVVEGAPNRITFVHPYKLTVPFEKLKKLEIEHLRYQLEVNRIPEGSSSLQQSA